MLRVLSKLFAKRLTSIPPYSLAFGSRTMARSVKNLFLAGITLSLLLSPAFGQEEPGNPSPSSQVLIKGIKILNNLMDNALNRIAQMEKGAPVSEGDKKRRKEGSAYLGLYLSDSDGKVMVSKLVDDGPAEKAGVKANDQILMINGDKIKEVQDLREAMESVKAGEKVRVVVLRDGDKQKIRILAGEKPSVSGGIAFTTEQKGNPKTVTTFKSAGKGKKAAIVEGKIPKIGSIFGLKSCEEEEDSCECTGCSKDVCVDSKKKIVVRPEGECHGECGLALKWKELEDEETCSGKCIRIEKCEPKVRTKSFALPGGKGEVSIGIAVVGGDDEECEMDIDWEDLLEDIDIDISEFAHPEDASIRTESHNIVIHENDDKQIVVRKGSKGGCECSELECHTPKKHGLDDHHEAFFAGYRAGYRDGLHDAVLGHGNHRDQCHDSCGCQCGKCSKGCGHGDHPGKNHDPDGCQCGKCNKECGHDREKGDKHGFGLQFKSKRPSEKEFRLRMRPRLQRERKIIVPRREKGYEIRRHRSRGC